MTKEEIRNELREILRVYHYESDTENKNVINKNKYLIKKGF